MKTVSLGNADGVDKWFQYEWAMQAYCTFRKCKVTGTEKTSCISIIGLHAMETCIADPIKDSVKIVARSTDIDSNESKAYARCRDSDLDGKRKQKRGACKPLDRIQRLSNLVSAAVGMMF